MSAYTLGEIKVNTVVEIEDLQELHFEMQKNDHAVIFLRGIITEEMFESVLSGKQEYSGIEVWIKERLLFAGLINHIQIIHEGNVFQTEIRGISTTVQLDCQKKNRTFQKISSTYQEVIREILADIGANLYSFVNDRKIECPLYQIEETDWEFIKRLAGHLRLSVLPSIQLGKPGIYIGIPQGKIHSKEDLGAFCEKVWMDKERLSTCRQIKSYEDMPIGDRVSWDGRLYTVSEKVCQLEKGILCFRYRIDSKDAFAAKPYKNQNAIGRFLSARVLDTKGEQVKVQFDIDEFQSVEEAYWYPWRPEMGNLVYCMPEKGEKVYIHLGGYSGEQAWAVCAVRENGEGHPEMHNTNRYFTTSDKKRMYLLPDEMGFQDLEQINPLEISLADDFGISTISNKSMVISAEDTIGIKGNNVFFQAPKEVSMVRRDSILPAVINMCNGFDSIGATNQVDMAGTGNEDFPIFHEYEQKIGKAFSLGGIKKNVIASTPGVRLKSGLEKQIRGIMVDSYE